MKFISSDKGQTLIEVIAAIAIGTLVIASLLALATRSNRNANFARSSAQASKLAQQGMEIIRNIRSVDATGYVINGPLTSCGSSCRWADLYADLPDLIGPGDHNFVLVDPGDSSCPATAVPPNPPNQSWCISFGTNPTPESISADLGNFTRVVKIEDHPLNNCLTPLTPLNFADIKLITVVIQWDDPAGSHETEVASKLSKHPRLQQYSLSLTY